MFILFSHQTSKHYVCVCVCFYSKCERSFMFRIDYIDQSIEPFRTCVPWWCHIRLFTDRNSISVFSPSTINYMYSQRNIRFAIIEWIIFSYPECNSLVFKHRTSQGQADYDQIVIVVVVVVVVICWPRSGFICGGGWGCFVRMAPLSISSTSSSTSCCLKC